jgi:hypothetical protein
LISSIGGVSATKKMGRTYNTSIKEMCRGVHVGTCTHVDGTRDRSIENLWGSQKALGDGLVCLGC